MSLKEKRIEWSAQYDTWKEKWTEYSRMVP